MKVTDIKVLNGAGFIVIYMGNILTMPGLSKNANYLNKYISEGIKTFIDSNEKLINISPRYVNKV